MKYIEFNSKDIPKNEEKLLSGKDYVYWGQDNLYPQFLIKLYYESAVQAGIIKNKINYIIGSGFEFSRNEMNNKFVSNGVHDKTLQDVLKDLCLDYELFDGFAIKVVRNAENKLSYIDSVSFENLRLSEDGNTVFYSENWSKSNQDETCNFREYESFDATTAQPVSILYYSVKSKNYQLEKNNVVTNLYPSPSYVGCIQDIMSTIEMSKWNYYEVINSWKSGSIVSFNNGEPDDTAKRKMEEALKNMVTPTENAGGMFISYNDSKEQAPEIISLNGNNLAGRYTLTEQEIKKNIFIGHSITTPTLFASASEGSLGNKNELETGFEIFVKTYVRERQNALEVVINVLASSLGYDLEFKLNEPEPPFKTEVIESEEEVSLFDKDEFKKSGLTKKEFEFIQLAKTLGTTIRAQGRVLFEEEAKELESVKESKSKFNLTDIELAFLRIFLQDNDIESVAKSLNLPYRDVLAIYEKLEKEGYFEDGEMTQAGIALLRTLGDEFIEVRYTYKLRPNMPLKPGSKGSRQFCKQLMAIFKTGIEFTRKDIERLNASAPEGNAFRYRGGWYRKPGTTKSELGCRHFWQAKFYLR